MIELACSHMNADHVQHTYANYHMYQKPPGVAHIFFFKNVASNNEHASSPTVSESGIQEKPTMVITSMAPATGLRRRSQALNISRGWTGGLKQ